MSYRPSGKGVKGPSEKEQDSLRQELGPGVEDTCISAFHTISRSERVDVEVRMSGFTSGRLILNPSKLIASLVKHIISTGSEPGGILIFLPGVQEIQVCLNALRGIPNSKVYPLHANLSSDEQRAVFTPVSGWKVIAATNVAEVIRTPI